MGLRRCRAFPPSLASRAVDIEGDRYFTQTGTYSNHPGTGRAITLIEIEAIEALAREYDVHLAAGLARRNLVTRGVALNHLVGKIFAVGAVVLRGMRLCEPCLHLEKLTVKGAAPRADSPRRAARRDREGRRDSNRRRHDCR